MDQQKAFEVRRRLILHKDRSTHWRDAHFAAARRYATLDHFLTVPSTVLAVLILAFAFWGADRSAAPWWTGYALGALAVLQAALTGIQLVFRPGAKAESHRRSATHFSSIQRNWHALEDKLAFGFDVVETDFQRIHAEGHHASREATEVPETILRKLGLPKDDCSHDTVGPRDEPAA